MSAQFDEFMREREAASNAYIRGDAAALATMLTHHDPATFMPPGGVVVQGAAAVKEAQVDGAAAFGTSSSGHFEVLNSGSSGDLAFWTGRQAATMNVKGRSRVRGDGCWANGERRRHRTEVKGALLVTSGLSTKNVFAHSEEHWWIGVGL